MTLPFPLRFMPKSSPKPDVSSRSSAGASGGDGGGATRRVGRPRLGRRQLSEGKEGGGEGVQGGEDGGNDDADSEDNDGDDDDDDSRAGVDDDDDEPKITANTCSLSEPQSRQRCQRWLAR